MNFFKKTSLLSIFIIAFFAFTLPTYAIGLYEGYELDIELELEDQTLTAKVFTINNTDETITTIFGNSCTGKVVLHDRDGNQTFYENEIACFEAEREHEVLPGKHQIGGKEFDLSLLEGEQNLYFISYFGGNFGGDLSRSIITEGFIYQDQSLLDFEIALIKEEDNMFEGPYIIANAYIVNRSDQDVIIELPDLCSKGDFLVSDQNQQKFIDTTHQDPCPTAIEEFTASPGKNLIKSRIIKADDLLSHAHDYFIAYYFPFGTNDPTAEIQPFHFEGTIEFSDIEDHWIEPILPALVDIGVIGGYSDGTFKPDQPITRAEFIKIYNMDLFIGLEADREYQNNFTDVQASDWFYAHVINAYEHRLIDGYEDGTFRPNQTITRAEGTCVLTNREEYDYSLNTMYFPFEDITEQWQKKCVKQAYSKGLVNGYSSKKFGPNDPLTRAEAAKLVSSQYL